MVWGLWASPMSNAACVDTHREWTGPVSDDPNEGGIPLDVRGQDQSEPHDSLPRLTEFFESTLVEFCHKLDRRGGGQDMREKIVKVVVVSPGWDGGTSARMGWH